MNKGMCVAAIAAFVVTLGGCGVNDATSVAFSPNNDGGSDASEVDASGSQDASETADVYVCIDEDNDGVCRKNAAGEIVDCNDADADFHPGAVDVCGNKLDEDCDGYDKSCAVSEENEENQGNESKDYFLYIEVVHAQVLEAIDISYGYCSNLDDPAQCHDWSQSVAKHVISKTAATVFKVNGKGVVRLNSSFWWDEEDLDPETGALVGEPNGWLCQITENGPTLMADVNVQIGGKTFKNVAFPVAYGQGCSAGINVWELVAQLD